MDYHSLVANNLHIDRHPTKMDARAEDLYYRERARTVRPVLGASIAAPIAVLLLLIGFNSPFSH